MGLAAGLGAYVLAFGGLVLALLVLEIGGRIEHWLMHRVNRAGPDAGPKP
jgi:uncharacterized membrane protein YhiD involved in acid resistance